MPFTDCPAKEVMLRKTIVRDSIQLSGAYEEIELLSPWSITAFRILWANGFAREVVWNLLTNLFRDVLDFHIRYTHGNSRPVPARNAARNIPRQIIPPEAASVRPVSIGRGRAQTSVIRHVDQEVCDPGGFELVDRIRNINLELDRVTRRERADIHLPAPRDVLRLKYRSNRNAYDACIIPR